MHECMYGFYNTSQQVDKIIVQSSYHNIISLCYKYWDFKVIWREHLT